MFGPPECWLSWNKKTFLIDQADSSSSKSFVENDDNGQLAAAAIRDVGQKPNSSNMHGKRAFLTYNTLYELIFTRHHSVQLQ